MPKYRIAYHSYWHTCSFCGKAKEDCIEISRDTGRMEQLEEIWICTDCIAKLGGNTITTEV